MGAWFSLLSALCENAETEIRTAISKTKPIEKWRRLINGLPSYLLASGLAGPPTQKPCLLCNCFCHVAFLEVGARDDFADRGDVVDVGQLDRSDLRCQAAKHLTRCRILDLASHTL